MSYVLAGKYRIDERLGEGGMGVVHAGHHVALDTPIAVKLLHPEDANDPSARSRFLREARRAASIQGEHSVRIFDVGEEPAPHIVMEMLVGENALDQLRRVGAFSVQDACTVMIQLLDAVAEAHGRGVVHRDLKPANVFMVNKPGERIWVKVLDFGIAKELSGNPGGDEKTVTELTQPNTMIGSPHYMSPEQMRTDPVDARSDLWSCGVILYELLSGKKPFLGASIADLGAKIISGEPAPLGPHIPPPVARMVDRCLRKDPASRPQNAYDLAAGLAPFATVEARGLLPRIRTWCKVDDVTPAVEPTPPSSRRGTFAGGVALVVGAGVCALVASSVVNARKAPTMSASAAAFDPPIVAVRTVESAVRLDPPVPAASSAENPAAATPSSSVAAAASAPRIPAASKIPTPASSTGRIRTVKDIELLQ